MKHTGMPRIKRLSEISIVILIALVFLTIYTYRNLNFFIDRTYHAQNVISISAKLHASFLESESSVRAYVLTRDIDFYDSYLLSKDSVLELYGILKISVSDNEMQVKNLEALKLSIDRRYNAMSNILSIFQDKTMDSVSSMDRISLLVAVSKIESRNVRNVLKKILTEEERILAVRKGDMQFNLKLLIPFLVLIFITGIVVAITNLYALNSFIKTSNQLNEKIEEYQEELKEQINVLNQANKDLEQFAYVASHDLQEPLRKIVSFSDLLNDNLSGKLNSEDRHYLQRIQNAASRMRSLINDLLQYSRVSRDSVLEETVDLNEIFAEVKDDLSIKIQEKNGQVTAERLPKVYSSKTAMRQLFQNLISNSLKFSKQDIPPVISIKSYQTTLNELNQFSDLDASLKYNSIRVSDNGIGIQKDFYNKIFDIFQRLHSKDEYEGSGIGLAISKKIVENAGGKIYVESEKNKGSTFILILPAE